MAEAESWDWSPVTDDGVREVLRQAELMMNDLLTSSCAADAKAATVAAIYGAMSAAMIAAIVAILALSKADSGALAALAVMALGFLCAALVSVGATRPRDYFASGNEPEYLIGPAAELRWLMTSTAESLQRKLNHNIRILGIQAWWMHGGYFTFIGTLFAGPIVFVVFHACR